MPIPTHVFTIASRSWFSEEAAVVLPYSRLFTLTLVTVLLVGTGALAAIVPTVQLGTAANYAVLAGSTVTNTGNSVLNGSLGLSPGTSITGFPPGIVVPPGTTDQTNAAAQQGQSALTGAYVDAAGRPVNANTTADLGNLILVGGVYSELSKGALSLTGTLTLDGQGDPNSVFIFQTNSTLTTASASVVSLIGGAQACNVFWQVGSSAILGSSSVFVGNILALTSISLNNGVSVEGRALARNGAVTLINDTFTAPSCALVVPTTTSSTTTTVAGATTSTTLGGPTDTTGATTSTTLAATATTSSGNPTGTTGGGGGNADPVPELPFTGMSVGTGVYVAAIAGTLGILGIWIGRRRRPEMGELDRGSEFGVSGTKRNADQGKTQVNDGRKPPK